ncbi:MAG: Uma2 family endonuclease [Chloroflexi bacterium]|nr:Uma2 family endonuclease [Chloroflexota bacterium]
MALQPTRRRFTVDEYYRMAKAGILSEDDRVELIDGEIIQMPPIGPRHAWCVDRLTELFVRTFSDAAQVRVQNPVRLSQYSEPQPDLALLRRQPKYAAAHPTPEDILLAVEVSDTSAAFDRRVKAPLYARSGIGELWLVHLSQNTVTVYQDPTPDGYRAVRTVHRGERLAPLAFPERELAVTDILGEG